MQFVNDRWYRLYGWLLTIAGSAAFALSAVPLVSNRFGWLVGKGFTALTLVLGAVFLIYRLSLFPWLKRRYELQVAVLGLNLLTMLQSINLINSTGHLHSWHHVGWLLMILWGGMFGLYMVLSLAILTTLYVILIMTNVPGQITVDYFSLLVLATNYVLAAISYFFWRQQYIDQESRRVAQLSHELKNRQRLAQTMLESITDGIIVTDIEGKVVLINAAAAQMTEWPAQDATGVDVQLVVKLLKENGEELSKADNPFLQVVQKHTHINAVLQLVGKSGHHRIVSLVMSPVLLQKKNQLTGVVAVIRDISSTRVEEKRRADFISTASHEMRTPVAAIEGYLALALNENVSKVDSKARDFLEKAHVSTQHLGRLFQDLLTSAKAEDGRLASHPVVVEMGAYLEQLVNDLRFAATKKGLTLEFVMGTDTPSVIDASQANRLKVVRPLYYVNVDPDRIREVISNIFDNAVKYTEAGKVSVGLTGNDSIVQLYIRDTGPGIPADDLPHLFQKFYRVDNSATRTIGGSGLGLFICKKIVELYNGRIWAESEVGKGSTFFINLPRLSTQRANELQAQQASEAAPIPTLTSA